MPPAAPAPPEAKRGYQAKNVVILVLDGERYTETWGDPQGRHIPRLKELAKNGVVFTNFWNRARTETNPAHGALITGRYQDGMDNHGESSPAAPSILQLWRKESGAPASAAWVICTKDKLLPLADAGDPQWAGRFLPSADCGKGNTLGSGYRKDAATMDAVLKVLARDHPRVVFINLAAGDSAGHAGDWEGYLAAIREYDALMGKLYDFLQKDPAYAGQTALFVTNDHGRHSDGVRSGFQNHGCGCDGCRHLLLFAIGPDFRKGVVTDAKAELVDVPVTAAELLGLKIADPQGRVLKELFTAPAGAKPGAKPGAQLHLLPARRVRAPAGVPAAA